jgi:hypothetical protein
MTSNRFRLRQTFWLDLNKAEEEELADQIELLKSKRTFARTVRQGIKLICELREKKVDLLLTLFPFVLEIVAKRFQKEREELDEYRLFLEQEYIRLEQEKWLLQEERRLFEDERSHQETVVGKHLSRIEKLLVGQGSVPLRFELPRFNDEEETVIINRDTSTDATQNFLNSLSSL